MKAQPWLGPARAWWPDRLFRFEPVEAAVDILEGGKFLSRAEATRSGQLKFDSASPEIILSTYEHWKEYVRLYFRPRSPTQYSSEGFRSAGTYAHGALCPMPIVFVLDAADILTRAETICSNGNLAASAETGSDASFLRKIPFETVYHDTWFDPFHRSTVIFHRQAEVIIPNTLDLSPVRYIGCRTQAEYETFLHLLSPKTRKYWAPKIGSGTKGNLHFRKWNFVEQATLSQSQIVFQFNPSCPDRGPFKMRLEITYKAAGKRAYWEKDYQIDDSVLKFNTSNLRIRGDYSIRFTIDGRIAYANDYSEESVPF